VQGDAANADQCRVDWDVADVRKTGSVQTATITRSHNCNRKNATQT
jgi:hypothetical protein